MGNSIVYRPITATPFRQERDYREIAPCDGLRGYVCCFWGSEKPFVCQETMVERGTLVIPDTCADLMYTVDFTDNRIYGGFCGISDTSFFAGSSGAAGHLISTFAIRFYAWSAYHFSEDSLQDTRNGFFDSGEHFQWLDRQLRNRLFDFRTLEETANFAQTLLLSRLDAMRENRLLEEAVQTIINRKGAWEISQLAESMVVSTRQLERIFHRYVGVSPKKLSGLIRYQLLWQDIVKDRDADVFDAVCKYGFTDQPHLLREFRRYHTMNIGSARQLAVTDVGNIQDKENGMW